MVFVLGSSPNHAPIQFKGEATCTHSKMLVFKTEVCWAMARIIFTLVCASSWEARFQGPCLLFGMKTIHSQLPLKMEVYAPKFVCLGLELKMEVHTQHKKGSTCRGQSLLSWQLMHHLRILNFNWQRVEHRPQLLAWWIHTWGGHTNFHPIWHTFIQNLTILSNLHVL